jgi:hypothetical protein
MEALAYHISFTCGVCQGCSAKLTTTDVVTLGYDISFTVLPVVIDKSALLKLTLPSTMFRAQVSPAFVIELWCLVHPDTISLNPCPTLDMPTHK